jgi:hypothetical protein
MMCLRRAAAFSFLALLAATGCSTPPASLVETVELDTAPAGATAQLTDGSRCTTPCRVTLRRFPNSHEVTTGVVLTAPDCAPLYTAIVPYYGPRHGGWPFAYADYHLNPNPLRVELHCMR